jgi:hypothetical protein
MKGGANLKTKTNLTQTNSLEKYNKGVLRYV